MSEAVKEKTGPDLGKFKPYPAYKDSGVEWLGEVPEHWDAYRLKHIVSINMGQSPPSDFYNTDGDGVPFLQGNAEFGIKHPSHKYWCSYAMKIAQPGDLLLSVRAPVGEINTADKIYAIGRGLCSLTSGDAIDKGYLWYAMAIFREGLFYATTGSTYDGISIYDLKNLLVVIPPVCEQNKITYFLNEKTAKIDALIAKQERLIELLQEKRTALITRAVTKGLDPDVPMKDSGVEWLGEIPAHWEVLPLKRRFEVRLGKMLQNEPKSSHDEYLPYLRAVNITWKGVDTSDINRMWFSPREKQLYDLQKYDLLVSEGGDVGRSALWQGEIENCYIQNAVNRVRSLGNDKTVFLYYWMFMLKHIGYIDMLCSKATIGHFTAEKVEKILVIFPPPKEQQLIIEVLDKEISKINKLIDRIEKAIDIIKEYRTALISAAVTGKIDVRREVP